MSRGLGVVYKRQISGWDTSRVEAMRELFKEKTTFNAQLNWDTSKVTTMQDTFYNANSFNQPLDWDTSSVKMMAGTFSGASDFNQPLIWDTSSATTMYVTFRNANAFNQRGIADWDVGRVSEFSNTFGTTALANDACSRQLVAKAWEGNTAFTSAYPSWDSTGGCPPSPPSLPPPPPKGVFEDKATLSAAVSDWIANEATAEDTHGEISVWDTSRVDDMSFLFRSKTTFNAQIGGWDTSKVKSLYYTFNSAEAFNSPLDWDTSQVTMECPPSTMACPDDMGGRSAMPRASTSRSPGTRAR